MNVTKYGFIKFENIKEFKIWLDSQKISRKIKKLQVHHTYSPSYKHFDGNNHFERQKAMKDYHVNNNKWSDIAQHFTIFPDGSILTGRSLNETPIGIRGANVNGICIEILGNFDTNCDVMNNIQKESIIAVYSLLCDKFNLIPSEKTITYHSWWQSNGVYLANYIPSKSSKTCPGLNFFGGNAMQSFKTNFLPLIMEYKYNEKEKIIDMEKIVLYFGDADIFAATLVSQKFRCPLMKKSDFENSKLKANEVIQIGGNVNDLDRYTAMKNACKYL